MPPTKLSVILNSTRKDGEPLSKEQIFQTSPCQIVVIQEPTMDPNKAFIGEMIMYPTADFEIIEDGVLVSANHFESAVPA
jgi:hypothetical protein